MLTCHRSHLAGTERDGEEGEEEQAQGPVRQPDPSQRLLLAPLTREGTVSENFQAPPQGGFSLHC